MIIITSNQVAYNQHLENSRANRAREVETYRHNLAQEDLGNRTLIETVTHNRNTEALQHEANQFNYAVGMENAAAHRYAADRSYAASVYSANVHAAATRYSADQALKASNVRASLDYAKSVQTSVLTNKTSVRNTQSTNATSRQNTLTNVVGNVKVANINAIAGLGQSAIRTAGQITGGLISAGGM